jgi:hypothetical protein
MALVEFTWKATEMGNAKKSFPRGTSSKIRRISGRCPEILRGFDERV